MWSLSKNLRKKKKGKNSARKREKSMLKVGLIGVGNMGSGMARNMLLKGSKVMQQLIIFDSQKAMIESFTSSVASKQLDNLIVASAVSEIAAKADVICLSLPSEKVTSIVLNDIIKAKNSVKNNKSLTIVDHGTFTKDFVVNSHNLAKQSNIEYLDGPVSGGPGGATAGTLTVMLGGNNIEVARVTPILNLFASKIYHFGSIGNGMAAKLVNQALVGIHAQAASEAIALADELGLKNESKQLLAMLSNSWGQSRILELALQDYINSKALGPHVIDQSPAPLRNLLKDFDAIQHEIGKSTLSGSKMLCTNAATSTIKDACANGKSNGAFVTLKDLIVSR